MWDAGAWKWMLAAREVLLVALTGRRGWEGISGGEDDESEISKI